MNYQATRDKFLEAWDKKDYKKAQHYLVMIEKKRGIPDWDTVTKQLVKHFKTNVVENG